MAINNETLEFLEQNKNILISKDILMIWRQSNGISKSKLNWKYLFLRWELYVEKLWEFFWCKNINSVDASDYENPTYIHNMNDEINNDLKNKFDIVFDGGSSEHIFNIPTVFNNYKKILKKWGYYIWVLPANNWCNHWFYQFSPDFFYRMFSDEAGYKTKIFVKINNNWYKVKDLKELNYPIHFNLFLWKNPALLFIVSEKIKEDNMEIVPLQTIYNMHIWEKKEDKIKNDLNKFNFNKLIIKFLPSFIKTKLWQNKNQKIVLEKLKFPIY